MKIIVGLGNIGTKYLKTRHNAGFLVIDQLIKDLEKRGFDLNMKEEGKLLSEVAKIQYEDQTILLVKPSTLMNRSGEALNKILHFYKAKTEDLLVIYDDIDLALGTIRFRESGSAGTHNGMRSVIECLGTEDIKRLRIGIESRGELTPKQQELHSFVLSDFTEKETPIIAKVIKQAVEEVKKQI